MCSENYVYVLMEGLEKCDRECGNREFIVTGPKRLRTAAGLFLSLALIDMTDRKMPTSKHSSKGPFTSRFKRLWTTLSGSPSRSTPPEPSALGQENPGKDMHSVSHAIAVSGAQLVNPGIGAEAVASRQGTYRVSFPRQTAHSRM